MKIVKKVAMCTVFIAGSCMAMDTDQDLFDKLLTAKSIDNPGEPTAWLDKINGCQGEFADRLRYDSHTLIALQAGKRTITMQCGAFQGHYSLDLFKQKVRDAQNKKDSQPGN